MTLGPVLYAGVYSARTSPSLMWVGLSCAASACAVTAAAQPLYLCAQRAVADEARVNLEPVSKRESARRIPTHGGRPFRRYLAGSFKAPRPSRANLVKLKCAPAKPYEKHSMRSSQILLPYKSIMRSTEHSQVLNLMRTSPSKPSHMINLQSALRMASHSI